MQSLQTIDRRNPINWKHPLNRDLAVRFLAFTGLEGGNWIDLCGYETGVLQNVSFATGLLSPGGGIPIYFPNTTNYLVKVTPTSGRSISNFTMGCWINAQNGGAIWAVDNGHGGGGSQNGLDCGQYTGTNQVSYLNGSFWANSGANINGIGWTRLVVTFNSTTGLVQYFMNGSVVGGTNFYTPLAIISNSYPLAIGGQIGGTALQGYIDDFFIANRIWTPEEIVLDNELALSGYPGLFNRQLKPPGAVSYSPSVYNETVSQTFSLTQTAVGVNASAFKSASILQNLTFTQTIGLPNLVLSQHVTETFSVLDAVRRTLPQSRLQNLTFTETATGYAAKGATQHLTFTETAYIAKGGKHTVNQTLAFTEKLNLSRPARINQNLVFTQFAGISETARPTCDTGALGYSDLGDMTLGVSCYKNPSGVDTDSITYTDTIALQRIYHKTISQTLTFNDVISLGSFTRRRGISDTLKFADGFYQKQILIGGNGTTGTTTTISLPVVYITIVPSNPKLFYDTLSSAYSTITLPAPQFGNSEVSQNKINLYKVMSRDAYTYIQSTGRLDVKGEYVLDRNKSLELRNFVRANIAEYIYYTTWDGKLYYGKLGNNPIEFLTDRRYANANEAVIVDIEFQGVRIYG